MTFPDEPFVSYFSGNTVQICPVGALTAKPYRFKARPWDLDQRESTCTTCSVGCRTVMQSSRDELLRYQGVDSDPVNWGWLCDRGRFNFEAVNSDHRLTEPMVAHRGRSDRRLAGTARCAAAAAGRPRRWPTVAPTSIALLGGARGTNEDAFAWGQFADAIDTPYRDAQLGDGLPAEILGLDRATIDEAANASTIVLLGPDLKEELPVLYLRLRDAAEKKRSQIIEFSAVDTGLTRYAWKSIRYEPGTQHDAVRTGAGRQRHRRAARRWRRRDRRRSTQPGRVGRRHRRGTADAARRCAGRQGAARAAPRQRRRCTVARDGSDRPTATTTRRHRGSRAAAEGKIELLVLLGADPLNDCPDADLARRAIAGARRVISLDTSPVRVDPAGRRGAGRRRPTARRPAPPPTSRVASRTLGPEGHRHRHQPARLDDRGRTRPDDRRSSFGAEHPLRRLSPRSTTSPK